jgi:hypothetical protein
MLRRCAVLRMRAISDHQRQVIERRSAHTERLTSREKGLRESPAEVARMHNVPNHYGESSLHDSSQRFASLFLSCK